MAVYNGQWRTEDYRVMFWIDPKRYRAMIWKRGGLTLVKRMHDKDMKRLEQRVDDWLNNRK